MTELAPRDELSKGEIRKDALQDTVEATATAVGTVATIVTTAVRDIARAFGGYATEVFEIRDAVRRAHVEHTTDEDDDSSADGDREV